MPTINLRELAICMAAIASALGSLQPSYAAGAADSFPAKPIHIVVPWSAGGFTDRMARALATQMALSTQQAVVVENRPGAAGAIGSEYVMRSPPDGYTLLLTTTDAFVKILQDRKFDPELDYAQIALLTKQPVFLAIGPKMKVNNVKEFITEAKARPNQISYASPGEGSAINVAMEGIADMLGVKLIHIPYKGLAPGMVDLIGGQVDLTLISQMGASGSFEAGKVKPIAITAVTRSLHFPQVPTFSESLVPNFQLSLWYGLAAAKGTPPDIVDKLAKSAKTALASREIRTMLEDGGAESVDAISGDMDKYMKSEALRWRQLVR